METPPVSPKPASQKRFGVLVIDDNKADRVLTANYLKESWPFESQLVIDYAADGLEALEKIRLTRFALLVLDWKMPGMSGGDVLRHIRKNGVHVPVIVVSGLERAAIDQNLDVLQAAFLGKNEMNPDTFYRAIATALKLVSAG